MKKNKNLKKVPKKIFFKMLKNAKKKFLKKINGKSS